MTESTDEIKRKLKKILSPPRYRHSLSVARLASKLGRLHGWSPKRAYRAGLLHDMAKEWTPSQLAAYCRRHKLKIPSFDFILKTIPNMLHGYVGAREAKRMGWITDEESLRAISSHTLGNAHMTVADKVLYVADLACPDRRRRKLKEIRDVAKKDLHRGFVKALGYKIKYNFKISKPIHPFTIEVWNKVACRMKP